MERLVKMADRLISSEHKPPVDINSPLLLCIARQSPSKILYPVGVMVSRVFTSKVGYKEQN